MPLDCGIIRRGSIPQQGSARGRTGRRNPKRRPHNSVHSMHGVRGPVPGLILVKWQIFRQWGRHARRRGAPCAVPGARLHSVQSVVRFWYLPRTHLHTHRFMRRRKGWRDRSIFGVVIVHVYGWSRGRPAQIPGTHQRHPAA